MDPIHYKLRSSLALKELRNLPYLIMVFLKTLHGCEGVKLQNLKESRSPFMHFSQKIDSLFKDFFTKSLHIKTVWPYLITRKYPLRGYILGSGAPGTPGVTPKTYGTTFICDIL